MYASFGKVKIKKSSSQELQMQGINLTDQYSDGQMERSHGVSTARFPYITTVDDLREVDSGAPEGYYPVAVYAWEKLFVVSNEPGTNGYKCYYGGEYCGDAPTLNMPKQFAVVNSKLVMWPDKVYFNLYENEMQSHPMTTAPLLTTIKTGNIAFRKAVTE